MSEMSGGFVRNERKDGKRMTEEKLYLAEKDGGAPYYLLRRVGHAYTRVAGIAAGISVNTGLERVTNDTHDDQFAITWIWEGRGVHTEKGETKPLTSMSVCIRRPDRLYEMRLTEKHSVRLYLCMDKSYYPALLQLIPELAYCDSVHVCPFRYEYYEEFTAILRVLTEVPWTDMYLHLPTICHYILAVSGIAESRKTQPLYKARTILSDPRDTRSLAEIAAECGIGYHTFRRRFAELFGESPGRFRIRCRIDAACTYLLAGEQIGVIADKLGYSDVYSFTHQFKQEKGVAPSVYRTQRHG